MNGIRSKPSIITPDSSFIEKSIGPIIRSRPWARSQIDAASSIAGRMSGASSNSRKPNMPSRLE